MKYFQYLMLILIIFRVTQAQASESALAFEYAPQTIQENARAGNFLPVKMLTKPISYGVFITLNKRAVNSGEAGIYIGVVVDNSKGENWANELTTAHIRGVHKHVTTLMIGNPKSKVSGYAELYGVRVTGLIPISYNPSTRRNYRLRMGSGEYKVVQLGIKVDDILLAVNDHNFPTQPDGSYPNTVKELEESLGEFIHLGMHKITHAVDMENAKAQIAVLDREIEVLDREIEEHDKNIERLDRELAELDEVKAAFDYLDAEKKR